MWPDDDETPVTRRWRDNLKDVLHQLEERFEFPARIAIRLVLIASVLFAILENTFPTIAERIVPEKNRVDTLLTILVFFICALIRDVYKQSSWLSARELVLTRTLKNIHSTIKGSIYQAETETAAYVEMCEIINKRGAKRIDMIQLSGQTATHLLERAISKNKAANIRLLLLHPSIAGRYNRDSLHEYHLGRIRATLDQIKNIKGGRIEIRFYQTEPSVCSVMVDDRIVCLGWYKRYLKDGILMIHSHDIPMVIENYADKTFLKDFSKSHFRELWADKATVTASEIAELK